MNSDPPTREDKWRSTLSGVEFQEEKRGAGQKKELITSLFDIAEGTTELAAEVRTSVSEQAWTRRVFMTGTGVMILVLLANIAITKENANDRALAQREIADARKETLKTSQDALASNREVLDVVKDTLAAVTASNATLSKVAKAVVADATQSPAAKQKIVDEVEASAAKAEVAALKVEEKIAPAAEKSKVRRRLKAAAKKADSMNMGL